MPRHSFAAVCAMALMLGGAASPAHAARLPEDHEYQRVLRAYMATLTEKDFDHGVSETLSAPPAKEDPEYRYRQFVLTLMQQPLIGSKRGAPAITAPARLFTLGAIEEGEQVLRPPVWPETLISFVQWDYEGNPYHDNRALKLRAFVTATIKLVMLDAYMEANPDFQPTGWYSYQLVYTAAPYLGFQGLLPVEVRKAYQAGVHKIGQRFIGCERLGEDIGEDMMAPVGLWYARQVVDDPQFKAAVDAHIGKLLGDPSFFHPAGYFVERGGLDPGFAGMANYFAIWTALATGRQDARDAVDRVYRLRAHLILPEPDGVLVAPTHFHTRIGMPSPQDQWDWGGVRDYSASFVTDEAAHLVTLPTAEQLAAAAGSRAVAFQGQINENTLTRGDDGKFHKTPNDEIRNGPWSLRRWVTYNFPATQNPGYEFYPPGAYAHRLKLEQQGSPMLKSPYLRDENFVRDFAQAFVVVKQPAFRAILHTGPIGSQDRGNGLPRFAGPLGFGGGQLSAFSTPQAGAVLVGRRSGISRDKSLDLVDQWRTWPIHAVTGATPEGNVFTSAAIVRPEVTTDLTTDGGTVTVRSVIPAEQLDQPSPALRGQLAYARTFHISPGGVRIETTLTADGKDAAAELYETFPVFVRENSKQEDVTATITLLAGGRWTPATVDLQKNIAAVRVERFNGAVEIRFDAPQAVRLAPQEWADAHLSRAVCRTLLVDLLAGDGKPAVLTGERVLRYTLAPAR